MIDNELTVGRRHPERAITRLLAGEATPDERRAVLRHLLHGCLRCGARLDKAGGIRSADAAALAAVVDRAAGRFPGMAARVAAERGAAESLLARLRKLAPARRRLVVTNAAAARGRAVCELLIDESRRHRHHDRGETLSWAELAVEAAELYDGREGEELRARALMERGNARRICDDFAAAEADFATAEKLLREGSSDPLVWAEFFSLRASLAKDRREFATAIAHLDRAAARFRRYEDLPRLAGVLVKVGQVHGLRGAPQEGVAPTLEALGILTPAQDDLRVIALGSLVFLVAETGNALEAACLIARVRPVVEQRGSALDRVRLDWVGARVARDLGDLATAERVLKAVRQAFYDRRMLYDSAIVSLDLVELYARLSRRDELRSTAREATKLFIDLRVEREAIAALTVLAQSDAGDATASLATLAAVVDRARRFGPAEPR